MLKAPENRDCYVFSNNPGLEQAAIDAGWKFIFVDVPLSDDSAESSFQTKYVKFLQFLNDPKYSYFKKYDRIIIADHKIELQDKHINQIIEVQNKPILIRDYPDVRNNIFEEAALSFLQERYRRFGSQTMHYLWRKLNEGYEEDCKGRPVCWTSLISYCPGDPKVKQFLDELYADLTHIGTSQCQIVWFMVSQKYTDIIQIIPRKDIAPEWHLDTM